MTDEHATDGAWSGADDRWHNLARGVHDLMQLRQQVDQLDVVDLRGDGAGDGVGVADEEATVDLA